MDHVSDGLKLGPNVGLCEYTIEGFMDGYKDRRMDGSRDGTFDGANDGPRLGSDVGVEKKKTGNLFILGLTLYS